MDFDTVVVVGADRFGVFLFDMGAESSVWHCVHRRLGLSFFVETDLMPVAGGAFADVVWAGWLAEVDMLG